MNRVWSVPCGRFCGGIGRVDITPPADAYHRNWGAALHDAAEGVHRPLSATALVIADAIDCAPHVLLTLDLGWLRTREMRQLLASIAELTGLDSDRIVITFSHTHAAINLDVERVGEPGGQHIIPYLEALPQKLVTAIQEARAAQQELVFSAARGRCDLAWQRDFWDAENNLYACGPNPDGEADDAVLFLRATNAAGESVFYLLNYACHPTTLAWENRLISPDYIGSMREVVEEHTGVPCLFALGVCGDLGPRDGFVGDIETAERNGRQLAYAALSAGEALPLPKTQMHYEGPLLSGATLGIWRHVDGEAAADAIFQTALLELSLPVRPAPRRELLLGQLQEWQQKAAAATGDELSQCRARIERLHRALRRLEERTDEGEMSYRIHLWRMGRCVFVLLGGEPYNVLQRALRARFPQTALVFAVLCNEPHSYILPREECGKGLYQDDCATLAAGALEEIITAIDVQLRAWQLR